MDYEPPRPRQAALRRPETRRTSRKDNGSSRSLNRAERRRAECEAVPSKHEIEDKLRWDRGTAYFAFDDHGGWEHDHIAEQIIEAALEVPGEKVFLAIEHKPPGEPPIGQRLKGRFWGCSFARDEEASRRLWEESEGKHGWVHEGLATGFISTALGHGYHVLVGSPQHGFKRPELKVPTFDPRDGEDYSLERRTIKFNKWYTDDFGPPVFKRAELAIWPQTKREQGGLLPNMFNGCTIEQTAYIKELAEGQPFPILDGWMSGTKGRDEHGCDVLNMWRLLRPANSEQVSAGNGSASPQLTLPPQPKSQVSEQELERLVDIEMARPALLRGGESREAATRRVKAKLDAEAAGHVTEMDKNRQHRAAGLNKPLIVQMAEKLWGPGESVRIEHSQPRRFQYSFNDGKQIVDPIKESWLDHTTNRSGTRRELIKMLQAKDPQRSNPVSSAVLVNAEDVIIKAKQWLWKGHLLRGAQELMSGLGGLGKSQIQICFVACVSAGLPWPDGAEAIAPMNVIVITAEDTLDQDVVPRLMAAGADLKRVKFLKAIKRDEEQRQFLLGEDLVVLEQMAAHIGNVGLITIDPVTAYMGGRMDANSNTQVRAQLGPLKDFAERSNIGMSTITHPAKAAGHRAIDHFIHSVAFINAGRIAHLVVEEMDVDPDSNERSPTGRVLFTNCKNNETKELMPTLAYRKEEKVIQRISQWEEITAPYICWSENSLSITADEALANVSGKIPDVQPQVQSFLRELLRSGPVKISEIVQQANKLGYTEKQLRTAKEKLKIKADKIDVRGGWTWSLPESAEDGL